MPRAIWLSNAAYSPSAYGRQTAINVPRLHKLGWDTAVVAFHGLHGNVMTVATDDGFPIRHYPGSIEDQWAQDVVAGHYGNWRADWLITLMDAWVLNGPMLAASGMRVAHWMPVDCTPLGMLDRAVLDSGHGRPIAMSEFGRQQLAEAGYSPLYVPHSQDTSVFKPLEAAEREEWREKLGYSGRFVIAKAGANQDPCRKAYGETFKAFAQFSEKHPEALLLIHSRVNNRQGCDLRRMAAVLGLQEGKQVIFGDQYGIFTGTINDATMARWFALPDVVDNLAYGEGFGLPAVEAQMCGTPVVLADNSTSPELCGAGWLAQTQPYWNRGHSSWWQAPVIDSIVDCYEQAFEKAGSMREQAREWSLAYDADTVAEKFWKPALMCLESEIEQGETSPIFSNKATKSAAEKVESA